MISRATAKNTALKRSAATAAAMLLGSAVAGFPLVTDAQIHVTVGVQNSREEHYSTAWPNAAAASSAAASHAAASHAAPSYAVVLFDTRPHNLERLSQAARDSARPLIGAPSWWPEKTTHQNVAALAVAGVVTFGIVWVLPEDISKWDKSVPMSEYLRRAYTMPPVWDGDEFYWNYIIHPVSGMWVYLMERNHDRSPMRGFLLSTAASVGWEYGFEAFIERPSIQDLLFTSTIGSAMGELAWVATKAMKKDGFTFLESIAITVINPAYVVNNGYR
jgi:hypothetical protein